MNLRRRVAKLEAARSTTNGADPQPFLTRDEMAVLLIHQVQKKLGEWKRRRDRNLPPEPRTPERIEWETKLLAAIERANEQVKALEASGRLRPVLENLHSKGYEIGPNSLRR